MTSIHHGSIGYALSPAGKAYKVRNNPPLSNHPKSLFQGCGVVGFVWAVRVSCDQSGHLLTHGQHQLVTTQLWSRVTHGPCSTNETCVSEACSLHLPCIGIYLQLKHAPPHHAIDPDHGKQWPRLKLCIMVARPWLHFDFQRDYGG